LPITGVAIRSRRLRDCDYYWRWRKLHVVELIVYVIKLGNWIKFIRLIVICEWLKCKF